MSDDLLQLCDGLLYLCAGSRALVRGGRAREPGKVAVRREPYATRPICPKAEHPGRGLLHTCRGLLQTSPVFLHPSTGMLHTCRGLPQTCPGLLHTCRGLLRTSTGLLHPSTVPEHPRPLFRPRAADPGREPRGVEGGGFHALHDEFSRRIRASAGAAGRRAEAPEGTTARAAERLAIDAITTWTIGALTREWPLRARLGARVRAIQTVPVAWTTAFGSRAIGAGTVWTGTIGTGAAGTESITARRPRNPNAREELAHDHARGGAGV